MEITALNEDGTVFQEPVYDITYEEVRNEYKPAEMGEVISSSLSPAEDLQVLKIYYSSGASNETLNFSEYVKNYNNIRQIVWCGGGSNTVCIFNHTDYLDNVKANNAEPVRINKFGKDSSGYAMGATPLYATPDKKTDFYYFKKSEWDASGNLKLYSHSSGSYTSLSYARYSRYIYLIYKKEDTE